MNDRRATSSATWSKAAIVLSLVAAGIAGAWWFAPDRAQELRECVASAARGPERWFQILASRIHSSQAAMSVQ
jgi:hypothetical protein